MQCMITAQTPTGYGFRQWGFASAIVVEFLHNPVPHFALAQGRFAPIFGREYPLSHAES